MVLAREVIDFENQTGQTKAQQNATVEIIMRYVLRASGPDALRNFKYVIFCNHINLNIRDNRIKITWRFFVLLQNVVYLICVVSISVVLFNFFLFCYYYYFFLYLFVRFPSKKAARLRYDVMAAIFRVATAFVEGIRISDFTFILIL